MNLVKLICNPGNTPPHSQTSLRLSFFPLFVLFQLTGMGLLTQRSSRLVQFFFSQCPKYLLTSSLVTVLVTQSVTTFMSSQRRMECALLLVILFQSTAHVSMYRNRKKVLLVVRNLTRASRMLRRTKFFADIKKRIRCQVFRSVCYMISLVTLRLTADNMHLLGSTCEKSQTCFAMGYTAGLVAPMVMLILLTSFVSFYSNVCAILKYLFGELVKEFQKQDIEYEYARLLAIYKEIVDVMDIVEEHFSYPVFATMLTIMGGLFRTSYMVMFQANMDYNKYFYTIITGFAYGYSMVILILRGSEANRYAVMARYAVMRLPGVLPNYYKKLKVEIRKEFKSKVVLTFWRIYVIERSMLINALGTLATYGILVATLGNVQS